MRSRAHATKKWHAKSKWNFFRYLFSRRKKKKTKTTNLWSCKMLCVFFVHKSLLAPEDNINTFRKVTEPKKTIFLFYLLFLSCKFFIKYDVRCRRETIMVLKNIEQKSSIEDTTIPCFLFSSLDSFYPRSWNIEFMFIQNFSPANVRTLDMIIFLCRRTRDIIVIDTIDTKKVRLKPIRGWQIHWAPRKWKKKFFFTFVFVEFLSESQ